jgi:hypothetical protein
VPGSEGDDATKAAGDLAGRAMAAIDQLVDVVHDKLLRPVIMVARTVAVSFILAICVIVLLVAMGVGLLRVFDVYLFASHQWASWATLGAASTLIGVFLWRFRREPST